jgi:hypothetical protein
MIRKKVTAELDNLLNQYVIERAYDPTPWMLPIVTPPKPKDPEKVRTCVDMRLANCAIIRERYVTPTLEDIIYELNGARHF